MQDQHARLLRAAVVTVVILALSTGAHLGGGGTLPPLRVFAVLAALTMLGVILIAKRTLRAPALVAVLGGGQFALHHAFGFFTTAAAVCAPASAHLHHSAIVCTGESVASHQHIDGGTGAVMLSAHVVATLVTAVAITRGEEALHAATVWLYPRLFQPLGPAPTPLLPEVRAIGRGRCPHAVPFLVSPPLRGPPAFH